MTAEEIADDIRRQTHPEKKINVHAIISCALLLVAVIFALMSVYNLSEIWDGLNKYDFRWNAMCRYHRRSYYMNFLIYGIADSLISSALIIVNGSIFKNTCSKVLLIIEGCAMIVLSIVAFPSIISSIAALVFGCLFIKKSMNE